MSTGQEPKIAATAEPNAKPPTLEASGRRIWLYPERRPGAFSRLRGRIAACLMVIYLVLPWLTWNGEPLLRLDVLAGRAYVFGAEFSTTDTGYAAFCLLFLALVLFFVTALWGRVWCGYACPQTVFVEWIIRPIEELIEGPAHHRRRNDALPLTLTRLGKKLLKHMLYLLVAAVVANVFLAYFLAPKTLLAWMGSSPAAHPVSFGVMVSVMLAIYADLSWFREQFCAFLCPYARFQSVLLDDDTPVVSYDARRGEPRGKRGVTGDCIDCGLCQRVCPTGIDIRQGLQLECIMCSRCTDACDMIMTSLKRETGLIRRASARELRGEKPRRLAPRALGYGLGLILVAGVFTWRLHARGVVDVTLMRVPGSTYTRLPDGRVSNLYTLRLISHVAHAVPIDLSLVAPAGAQVVCPACRGTDLGPLAELKLPIVVAFAAQNQPQEVIIRAAGGETRASLLTP